MSLDSFTLKTWTIDYEKNGQYSKAENNKQLNFVLGVSDVGVTYDAAGDANYRQCWSQTSLQYDEHYDCLSGVMIDAGAIRYVSISLDRTDKTPRINCYVSPPYAGGGGSPDDGSWTAHGH